MPQKFEFDHLLPSFSEKEKKDIELYYTFSKEVEKQIQAQSRDELDRHRIIGPLIKSIPAEVQETSNKISDTLQRAAIFEDKWQPYIHHLMIQGVQYAHMGLDFKTWYDLVAIYRKYYVPILNQMAKNNEVDRVLDITNGMNVFFDYVMCVIGDSFIQERNRKIEEQNKRLEGMVKELESFAYIISHDLKTPLRGIASLSDWILQDYRDKLDDTGKEYLDLLKNRVLRLELLIDGVLAYSRAGRAGSVTEQVDLNTILSEVIEMLDPSPHVKIHVDNTLPTLLAVKSSMTQVFSNLVGNAIKHNDKEEVEIHVGSSEHQGDWLLYVRDNGPGIPEEFHEKVFKIFQTLKTKDEVDSTGIGLSIVKKIIDSAGGKIWIESKTGEGSTFYFILKK
jgi:signal transduction histidine kinase